MSDGLRAFLAFGGAALLAVVSVALARRVALAADFLDHPRDYRKHAQAVPYLGGLGVLVAFTVVAAALGNALSDMTTIVVLALVMALMGSADDHRLFGPGIRFGVQVAAALILWAEEIRWEPFASPILDLPITLAWVVGLTNAFNLLDNIDGAAATTAAFSGGGIGAIALHRGDAELAAVAFALSGACTTFLLFNFSNSHKIFLGDGGSMPIGFLIASLAMLLPSAHPEVALLAAVPLVGAAIFDTTLVVISRYRRGAAILSGDRDHSTHRLLGRLDSAARVCGVLAAASLLLCGLSYAMYEMSEAAVLLAATGYIALGVALLVTFERVVPVQQQPPASPPHPVERSI